MEIGQSLIVWTARFAVAFYVLSLWRFLFHVWPENCRQRDGLHVISGMVAWTLLVLHVLCAFAYLHRWSHQAAWEHTAAVTEQVTGLNWGGGLYVNYVFLAVWSCFAVGNLKRSAITPGVARCESAFHALAVFMMFNATAVFGPWWWWIIVPMIGCGFFVKRMR